MILGKIRSSILKKVIITILAFVIIYILISLLIRPSLNISTTETTSTDINGTTQQYIELEINSTNLVHKVIYSNKEFTGLIKIDNEFYNESISLKLGEKYDIYLDTQKYTKGEHSIEIIITDISTPEIVYGTKNFSINL